VVGYYGAIASWFDVEAVARRRLAGEAPPSSWIGRESGADLTPLDGLPNVHRIGELPYERLPEHLAAFDVCTIPFQRTPLTEATNPVKLFEYLATGKRVVALGLPEILPLADLVELYDSAEQFDGALERAPSAGPTKRHWPPAAGRSPARTLGPALSNATRADRGHPPARAPHPTPGGELRVGTASAVARRARSAG
jgi:hypothetical protein